MDNQPIVENTKVSSKINEAYQHGFVATCLAGMLSVSEVEDNVEGVNWSLTESDLREIDEIVAKAAGTQGNDHYVVE